MSEPPKGEPLILALPSKGRLKEQADAWLADSGFAVQAAGGARGYRASIDRLPGVQVQLLSPSDIAAAVDSGEVHLGVTGEDLLRERGRGDRRPRFAMLLRALGFGRADVVVAAPKSWIDVDAMADVEEVAAAYLARTGRRMRVATKYLVQTRAFFSRHGVCRLRSRIVGISAAATEKALRPPGAAELIVDITTTGATLAANNLKVLSDGVILKSEAQLAAGLKAPWTRGAGRDGALLPAHGRGARPRQGPCCPRLAARTESAARKPCGRFWAKVAGSSRTRTPPRACSPR